MKLLPARTCEVDRHSSVLPVRTSIKEQVSAPLLLFMAGFAGVGKTTLARWLNARLRQEQRNEWKLLNKDGFKINRLITGEEEKLAGWNAHEDLFKAIRDEVIEQGHSVIVDVSNEMPFIFETIIQMLNKHFAIGKEKRPAPFDYMVYLCITNQKVRSRRLHERGSSFFPHIKRLPSMITPRLSGENFNVGMPCTVLKHFNGKLVSTGKVW
jgi:predicted ABC-type ATPase